MSAPEFVVCMLNARHSDGRTGDAYIGINNQFSTTDPAGAQLFSKYEAEDRAAHWRGWYRGFHGGVTIEVRAIADRLDVDDGAFESENRLRMMENGL